MFHNPFNNKVVADITKFLSEHRDDINIDPCLNIHAVEAANIISEEIVLEERRNTLSRLFNEAVEDCGCRGNRKDIADFSKAVDKYVEEAKKQPYAKGYGKVGKEIKVGKKFKVGDTVTGPRGLGRGKIISMRQQDDQHGNVLVIQRPDKTRFISRENLVSGVRKEEIEEVEEAKAIVVPGKKVSVPSPHANELKKVKPTVPGK